MYIVSITKQDGSLGIFYREWAPHALRLSLVGDFNNWNPKANEATLIENGIYELFLADTIEGWFLSLLVDIVERQLITCQKSRWLLQLKTKILENPRFYIEFHLIFTMQYRTRWVMLTSFFNIDKECYVGLYWNFERHNHRFKFPTRQSPALLEHTGLRYSLWCVK